MLITLAVNMPQEKPLTPEKQLLNLIEKPLDKGSLRAAAVKYQGSSIFSLGALRGRFAFFKKKSKVAFGPAGFKQLDIKILNTGLKFFVFILAAYFIFSLLESVINLKKGVDLKTSYNRAQEVKPSAITGFSKAASYYLEKARERDIFSMAKKSPSLMDLMRNASLTRASEATKHLLLVGISWSGDPDVMIEDTRDKRTFFLKKGQLIDNQIKVEAIFKDHVILSYGGEETELR